MPSLARFFLLASALLLAPGAAAQPTPQAAAPPEEGQEMVVTGEALEEQVRDFVTALTPAPVQGQIGRFEQAVCPVAVGVPASQTAAIVSRMRRIAREVGLDTASDGCVPNIVLVVTDDKGAFLRALRRRQPAYFDGLEPSEVRRLFAAVGPAVAWQTPGWPLGADGVEVRYSSQEDYPTLRTTRPPSRITAPTRLQFENAVVVVERRALEGLTTTQLADYAAMRSFARADPARLREPLPATILTVLEAPMGSAVPVTLTAWDFNFLRGLYRSRADLYAPAQRGEIGTAIRQGLERLEGSGASR